MTTIDEKFNEITTLTKSAEVMTYVPQVYVNGRFIYIRWSGKRVQCARWIAIREKMNNDNDYYNNSDNDDNDDDNNDNDDDDNDDDNNNNNDNENDNGNNNNSSSSITQQWQMSCQKKSL